MKTGVHWPWESRADISLLVGIPPDGQRGMLRTTVSRWRGGH